MDGIDPRIMAEEPASCSAPRLSAVAHTTWPPEPHDAASEEYVDDFEQSAPDSSPRPVAVLLTTSDAPIEPSVVDFALNTPNLPPTLTTSVPPRIMSSVPHWMLGPRYLRLPDAPATDRVDLRNDQDDGEESDGSDDEAYEISQVPAVEIDLR